MAKQNVEKLDKSALRVACKEAGISYSKLTVARMREALLALRAPAPVVTTPAPESTPLVLEGVTREVRNGVKRPLPGGKCDAVWQALDQLRAAGVDPSTKEVKDLSVAKGWNTNNSTAELSQWRRFHGIARSVVKEPKLRRGSEEEQIPYTA